jgi:hypothetical protein
VTGEQAAAIIGVSCLAFYVLATLELLALLARGRASPDFVSRLAPESTRAQGLSKVIGIGWNLFVAVFTQALVIYVLVSRQPELTSLAEAALLAEVVIAGVWTVYASRLRDRPSR